MVAQKCCQSLFRLRFSRRLSHPAQHRSLRNLEAQHLELAVNARRTPSRFLGDHAEDEFAQFLADAFSSSSAAMPREPSPIHFKSRLVPANGGLRLDKDQGPFPFRPKPPQHQPEQFVMSSKSLLRTLLFQNGELLPESHVFQQGLRKKRRSERVLSQQR